MSGRDERRVCDMTAAELLDAAWQRFAELGWTQGHWEIGCHLDDGVTRRVVPDMVAARPLRVTVGRRQLERPPD